jgi:hypothetical protein
MADTSVTSPTPKKRRGWLRTLAWILGVLVVLIIVVYFVATSSAFFKGVILPKVGAALNAKVTVSDASISPFKQVILRDLKVETTGTEPLVSAPEVRLRYSLMDIIGGNIHVDEVTLVSPTVVLVENPDGTSNLDPLLKAQKEKPQPAKPEQPAKPSKPMQIDLKKFALTDATVRKVKLYAGNQRDVIEVSHINVTLDDLKNGQAGKLALGADISIQNNPPAPGVAGGLQAKLTGSFSLALTPDLKPGSIQGSTRLEVTRAEGALSQLAALAAIFDCEVTPTSVKQVALRFQQGSVRLGELRVSGPFDMEKVEGRLAVEILNIDRQVLNLAGAKRGIDFGPTTINSTNEVQISKAGAVVGLAGRFNLNQLQVTITNLTTPPLDVSAEYNLTVDTSASNLVLRAFTLAGAQRGTPFLRGELTSPMNVSWANTANAAGDSTLNLAVTHFNLADWKAFLGAAAFAGDANAKLQLLSQKGGKQLTFALDSSIDNLTAGSGSNQISVAAVTLLAKGTANDFKQFILSNGEVNVSHAMLADQKVISVTLNANASVQYDPQGGSAIKASLQVTNLVVNDPKGQFPATPLAAQMQADASYNKQVADIRQFQFTLTPTARAANQIQLTGHIDMTQTNAITGNLKVAADSLDVTSYYDLFTGQKQSGGKASAPATAAAGPEVEPNAMQLPFRNFVAEASVGRFYLHELEITNLLKTVRLDGGKVLVKPLQMAVNGAPVSGVVDLDLGVPGFKYDISFSAEAVPLAPLVNTFQPERKGQIGGAVTAQAKISGAGITGASLQKNLNGQFDFAATNLNLAVANIKSPLLRTLVNVISTIPDLARNPASVATSLLGSLTQKAGAGGTGGLSDDLAKSPIDQIIARASIGSGKVNIQRAFVQSPAFQAQSAGGTVTLDPVLTNSVIQFPISISLTRPVAQRINMVPSNTPTNATYVALPDFLTIKGTLGKPKSDINSGALAKAVLQGVGGGGKVGNLIQGILPGGTGASAATNQPSGTGGLLKGLGGSLLGSPPAATTNAPSSNATQPPATGQSTLKNLLNPFLNPKK